MRLNIPVAALLAFAGTVAPHLSYASDPTAELIVNGGFEDPALSVRYSVLPAINGWTVGSLGVEVQTSLIYLPYDGNQYIELDTNLPKPLNDPSNSYIYQDVQTLPGRVYDLSFAYAVRTNSPDNGIEVCLNGLNSQGGTLLDTLNGVGVVPTEVVPPSSPLNWTLHNYTFRVDSATTRVSFEDISPSNLLDRKGGLLDEVSMKLKPLTIASTGGSISKKAGSTLKFEVQIGTDGQDLSSSLIQLKAVGIITSSGLPVSPGGSNPDLVFSLVNGVYTFSLKTTGMAPGSYNLVVNAGDDPTPLLIPFTLV